MKNYIITLFLIAFSLPAVSQKSISFQTDFGFLSKINYQGAGVHERDNFNLHFGFNYTHFIKPKLALETGLGLSNYKADIMLPSVYNGKSNEVDASGSGFEFRAATTNYVEEQQLLMATIPLRLRFEGALTPEGVNFYASGGVKFMLPVSQEVNVTASNVSTTGFYPNNNLLIKDVPVHGFANRGNVRSTVDSPYKFSLALSTELGVKLRLENYDFYFGGFLDYGLTDIRKNAKVSNSVIAYVDADAPLKSNGVSILKGVNNVRLISFGLQLRFPLYKFK